MFVQKSEIYCIEITHKNDDLRLVSLILTVKVIYQLYWRHWYQIQADISFLDMRLYMTHSFHPFLR